jgi:hypothetical protein
LAEKLEINNDKKYLKNIYVSFEISLLKIGKFTGDKK